MTRGLFPYDETKQLEAILWLCIRVSIYIFFVLELVSTSELLGCFSNRRLTAHLRHDFLNASLTCREICDGPPVTEALHKSTSEISTSSSSQKIRKWTLETPARLVIGSDCAPVRGGKERGPAP